MNFKLPELPYAMDALAPAISAETLEYHYGKHHKSYVDKLNTLVGEKPEKKQSLADLILSSSGGIFNNAAQIWNHSFYWNCLAPKAGGEPKGKIKDAIKESFGSFEEFKTQFTAASLTLFGSGWTWLAKNSQGKLEIVQTKDAGNPMTDKKVPILTCDVWEHAYYIDYRNQRPKYVEAFWSLVNWEFAESQYQ